MSDRITVTVTDHKTGDTETQELVDYVFVGGTHRCVSEQVHKNGTVVLTIKPTTEDGGKGNG